MNKSIWDKVDEINELKDDDKKQGRYSFPMSFFSRYIFERLAFFSMSNKFRVGCYKNMGVDIGSEVYLGNYLIFDRIFPEKIHIGDNTSIGDRCIITAHANIPADTPLKKIYPRTMKETRIGTNVWIMPSCIITPGVTIGDFSVIASGAVITKDVPPMVLAGGVPAKPLKDLAGELKPLLEKDIFEKLVKARKKMGYTGDK
jgi:acetyltransferase-like isoleucine patch superfamily enzyme